MLEEIQARLTADSINTPFLIHKDGQQLALSSILQECNAIIHQLIEGITPETRRDKLITKVFPEGEVCVRGGFGETKIKAIDLWGNVGYKQEITPAHAYSQYSDEKKQVVAEAGHINIQVSAQEVAEIIIAHGVNELSARNA